MSARAFSYGWKVEESQVPRGGAGGGAPCVPTPAARTATFRVAALLAATLLATCAAAPTRTATTGDRDAVVGAAEAAGRDCAARGLGGNTLPFRRCFTERLDARLAERGLRLPAPSEAPVGGAAPPGQPSEAQIQELLRRNPRCSRVGSVVYC